VFEDRVILKLGFFDELDCGSVAELEDVSLPAGFVVRGVQCNIRKQYVCVSVFKTSAPTLANALKATPPARATANGGNHLEIAYAVNAEDVAAVQRAIDEVVAATPDAMVTSISKRATLYEVYLAVGAVVPAAGCHAAAAYDGVLNFETAHIEMRVPRKFTNI